MKPHYEIICLFQAIHLYSYLFGRARVVKMDEQVCLFVPVTMPSSPRSHGLARARRAHGFANVSGFSNALTIKTIWMNMNVQKR